MLGSELIIKDVFGSSIATQVVLRYLEFFL